MQEQIQLALEIATLAHKNQYRRNGEPYIMHVIHVASNKEFIKESIEQVVALLHDTVEDTSITKEQLFTWGIDPQILELVDIVTKKPHDKYEDYIERICTNKHTMRVKLSDLSDNMDASTLVNVTVNDEKRMKKYQKAKDKILTELKN